MKTKLINCPDCDGQEVEKSWKVVLKLQRKNEGLIEALKNAVELLETLATTTEDKETIKPFKQALKKSHED